MQQNSYHVCLSPRHYQAQLLWCRESVYWRAEWLSVVFSDDSRFCLQLYASDVDVHMYGINLVSIIFRSAFTHDTQAPPLAPWFGDHQLQLEVTVGVAAG